MAIDSERLYAEGIEEFLNDPRRVSILACNSFLDIFAGLLRDRGMLVDLQLPSLDDVLGAKDLIRREGVGTLAIVGAAAISHRCSNEDATWAIPGVLERVGAIETPTVFIPTEIREAVNPRTGRVSFTRVLDISDIALHPSRIFSAGADLVGEVVAQKFVNPVL